MRRLGAMVAGVAIFGLAGLASAVNYPGNGNTGFGGPIGQGSLDLTDNGTTVSGTLNKGPNSVNDVLVLYIDSVSGGFSDTNSFGDANDGLRKAISGFDGGSNRSVLTMPAGFTADYAIALGPASDNFGGLWQLASGGNLSLPFVNTVNLNPTGNANSATYTFSFNLSDIGTPSSFKVLGTYTSNTGYRSDEFVAGNATGVQGYNPFVGTSGPTYAVPEPSSAAILLLGAGAMLRRFRKGR